MHRAHINLAHATQHGAQTASTGKSAGAQFVHSLTLSLTYCLPYRGRCKEGGSRCLLFSSSIYISAENVRGRLESRSIGGLFASASCSCKRPLRFWTDGRTDGRRERKGNGIQQRRVNYKKQKMRGRTSAKDEHAVCSSSVSRKVKGAACGDDGDVGGVN